MVLSTCMIKWLLSTDDFHYDKISPGKDVIISFNKHVYKKQMTIKVKKEPQNFASQIFSCDIYKNSYKSVQDEVMDVFIFNN